MVGNVARIPFATAVSPRRDMALGSTVPPATHRVVVPPSLKNKGTTRTDVEKTRPTGAMALPIALSIEGPSVPHEADTLGMAAPTAPTSPSAHPTLPNHPADCT